MVPATINIQCGRYRVERQPPGDAGAGTAMYTVYRPDGSICCSGVVWADVERAIEADGRRTGVGEAGE